MGVVRRCRHQKFKVYVFMRQLLVHKKNESIAKEPKSNALSTKPYIPKMRLTHLNLDKEYAIVHTQTQHNEYEGKNLVVFGNRAYTRVDNPIK